MKLPEQEIFKAQKKFQLLSNQLSTTESIKNKIKEQNKNIGIMLDNIKQSTENDTHKINLIAKLIDQALNQSLRLDDLQIQFSYLDEKIKEEKDKCNSLVNIVVMEKIKVEGQKSKYSQAILDIRSTINKIQKTMKETSDEQEQKRINIEADLERSLKQIRQKIKIQDEQTKNTMKQTAEIKTSIIKLRMKLEELDLEYGFRVAEKSGQVESHKGQLIQKLKELQYEATSRTNVNNEFSSLSKKNFHNRLSIHMKQTKFQQYSQSFQNNTRILNQCKQQLFKGVQKISSLQLRRSSLQSSYQKNDKQYNDLLSSNNLVKQQIDKIKKSKEGIRTNILALQSQIKTKREPKAD